VDPVGLYPDADIDLDYVRTLCALLRHDADAGDRHAARRLHAAQEEIAFGTKPEPLRWLPRMWSRWCSASGQTDPLPLEVARSGAFVRGGKREQGPGGTRD
jgi:hypothetical protein